MYHQQGLRVTYSSLLKVCINTKYLAEGRIVHCLITTKGLDTHSFLGAHLIRMYAVCGSFLDAFHSFTRLPNPNVFAWSAIISAHAKLGQPHQAIMLYDRIELSGAHIDAYVMVSVLTACTNLACLQLGKVLHVKILARDLLSVNIVGNVLVNMYAKCGDLVGAAEVLGRLPQRDVVTWNTLISGYADHGHAQSALHVFLQMLQEGMRPDHVTFVAIMKSSLCTNSLNEGKLMHGLIVECGMEAILHVGSTLIDMYAANGNLEDAHEVFIQMPERNIVTWTAMAAGYTQHGHSQEALHVFQQMQQEGLHPDHVTLVSILQACSKMLGLDQGKAIHTYILDHGDEADAMVGSALIDMYFKCGSIEGASRVFDKLPRQNVVIWNTMIAGYAQHGAHKLALQCFCDMRREGLVPDDTTFVSILSACSHAGILNIGCCHFESMRVNYGLAPAVDHYMCMVDLLGRTGCVKEAEALLQTVPFWPCEVGWRSLLTHCRTSGNVDLARQCFNHLTLIDAKEPTTYALMSEIYANAGMMEDLEKIEEVRNCAAMWKTPGEALVEVDRKVHGFMVGDGSHLESEIIQAKLASLNGQLKDFGYVPLFNSSAAATG